jgi:hypothetical protein
MKTIRDFKYKLIKNFLTKEEIKLLTDYCRMKHMINKLDIMQKETGLELLCTYAFWRMYTINADLKKHKDRPSCEVSVTVMIGSDGTSWPIYMDGAEINLEPGDAAVYLGCEIEHWREEFKGDWHAQTFLHYVDKNGPNKEWFKDKRLLYGINDKGF